MKTSLPRPVLFVPLVFLLGMFVARLPATISQFVGLGGDFLGPISDARQMLADSYVEEPDMTALQTGAMNGMLEALNDPYAQYIPKKERADFEKEMMGRFCGIGAQVQIEGGYPTIVTPLEDSPAFRAGILAGDKIIEVDGKPTLGVPIDDCITLLTGLPNTKVVIKVRRAERTFDLTLVRQQIVVRAVKGVERAGPDGAWNYYMDPASRIAYIRLSQFIPTAPQELAAALEAVGAPDGRLAGLILDLRNNPGGDLDACLDIADMFLKSGIIVSVKGRQGRNQDYAADPGHTLPDFPMAVLVNGLSASASEILAGALSDHKRAIVIGSRTFGKGLVQAVRTLPTLPEAQIKYTIQHYFLPSGRQIQRSDKSKDWGVDPTPGFYIPMTDQEELAYQLQRRDLDILGEHAADPAKAPRWDDPEWIGTELKDKPLAAALRALRTRITTGDWQSISDATQQFASFSLDELRRLEKTHQRMLRAMVQVEERMNAMDSVVSGATSTHKEPDLWPDDLDLTNGAVRVTDKDGKVVASLRITGRELERWLVLADVEPEPADPTPPSTPEPAPAEHK